MDKNNSISRRKFIAGATTTAVAALAGCGGDSGGTPTDADGSTATPTGGSGTTTTGSGGGPGENYRNGVPSDASVSLAVPSGGAELSSTFAQWQATAEGVTIESSGQVTEGAGHYHVMIDAGPVTPGEVIPSDESHVHYGTGQSDGVLELEPGEHTLTLQVADGKHRAMDLTDEVTVTVSDEAALDLSTTVSGSVVEWEVTAQNYDIVPASEGIQSNTGHLHAVIDADHVPVGEVIPSDANHVHFGDGSTSGTLDLAEQLGDAYDPGEHTIHFQVGTGTHRATMVHAHTTVTTE